MFPSVFNTFNRPSPTDRLNSPSHSALHNTVSSAVGQIEAVIGTNTGATASAVGTLMYDIRSPLSGGGGHIQTAVLGGTGQNTFTKGDLLVATGPSTISKLAVSSVNNEVLIIDTNQAAGIKWATNPNSNKVAISTTTASIYNSNTEQVLFSASILGSTLGTSNAVKFKGVMRYGKDTNGTFTLRTKYGLNTILTNTFPVPTQDIASVVATYEGMIVADTTVSAQKGFGYFDLAVSSITGIMAFGTASINSTANQDLVITGQFSSAQTVNSVLTRFFVVEKIT